MKPMLELFAPTDAATGATPTTGAPPTPKETKRKSPAAFDRKVAAELQEAQDIAAIAADARFATMLNDEYEITPAEVAQLQALVVQARAKFGLASSGAGAGAADTGDKDAAENALIAALRKIQTGARLTYPMSASNQARYFIGTILEQSEPQLAQIATTMLENLKTDVLKSITPAKIQAVTDALAAWQTALATQTGTKGASYQDRAQGRALMDEIDPQVREIKIAIDGQYPYTQEETRAVRKLFHLTENRPFTYTPHEP